MNNNINKEGFYSRKELKLLGFKKLGKNVLISKKSSIYGIKNISIGNNVRIDDFCVLSGTINIKNYVHIGAHCYLCGGKFGIEINDFSNISGRVSIYAQTDDFSGQYLISPMVNSIYTNVKGKKVILEKYALIGTGSIILYGVVLRKGSAIGANSLVKKSTKEWSIYAGTPAKKIKNRSKDCLQFKLNN